MGHLSLAQGANSRRYERLGWRLAVRNFACRYVPVKFFVVIHDYCKLKDERLFKWAHGPQKCPKYQRCGF